nr:LamG domain-containing protein [bacterium]
MKTKQNTTSRLFSFNIFPILAFFGLLNSNLLLNLPAPDSGIIAKQNFIHNSYYSYQEDDFAVGFGSKISAQDELVTFSARPIVQSNVDQSSNSNSKQIAFQFHRSSDNTVSDQLLGKIWQSISAYFKKSNWQVSDQTATFKNIDTDLDLQYEIVPGRGLKEELIINGTQAVKNQYQFDLQIAKGSQIKQSQGNENDHGLPVGTYYITDQDDNYIAHFLPLLAYDSNGLQTKNIEMEIAPASMYEQVSNLSLQYIINITIDPTWLSDPARQYPVIIDPTIVHDSLEDFATGTAMNRIEAVAGPKVQLANQELAVGASTIGLWHMNETSGSTVTDFSGNSNNGTATGTTVVDGKLGKARSFNGTSDLINLAKTPSVKGTSQVTIEGWIYPTSLTNYFPIFYESNNTSGYTRLMLRVGTDGSLNMGGRDTDGTPSFVTFATSATGLITTNKWYHVAGVYNADTDRHKVYINGIDVTSSGNVTAATFPNTSPADNIYLGFATGGTYGSGILDEVRLTKRALTQEEIKVDAQLRPYGVYTSDVLDLESVNPTFDNINWTENGVRTGDGETDLTTANLVAQWNFNETSGTTATSGGSCGTSCNGTLTNMTTTGQDVAVNSGWTANNKKWGAGALMFDGTDDYVSVPDSADYDFGTGDFAVGLWMRIPNDTTSKSVIGNRMSTSTDDHWNLEFYTTTNRLEWHTSATIVGTSLSTIPVGKWTYVVITRTAGVDKFYINGINTSSFNDTFNYNNGGPLYIGRDPNSSVGYFNGNMDNIQIYKGRSLTADEILSNYQAGNVQLQTRTGTDDTPDDGSWEEWRPAGSGTETDIDNMDEINQPNSISGLAMWLKADSITGLNDNDTVSNWPDSSGNNRYAAQSTSSYQPIYKTNVLNGQPVIRFDGADDALPIMDSNPQSMTSISMFMVHQINSGATSSSYYPLILGGDGNTTGQYLGFETQNSYSGSSADIVDVFGGYGNDARATLKNEAAFGSWKMWSTVSQNTVFNTKMYVNGTPATMSSTGTDQNLSVKISTAAGDNWGNIGGTHYSVSPSFYKGDIAEVLIYNRALSDTERRTVEQYLANKYNLNTSNQPITTKKDNLIKQEGSNSTKLTTGAAQADANTVALWHLDETGGSGAFIKDGSGNSNNGTPTGTSVANGISGKARSFNGSSDYVLTGTTSFPSGDSSYTDSVWIKMNTLPSSGSYYKIMEYGTCGTNQMNGMSIYNNSGTMQFGNYNYGSDTFVNYSFIAGQWYLLTVVHSGTSKIFYVNGSLVSTVTSIPTLSITTTRGMYIGAGDGGSCASLSYYFNGIIDEVKISDIARTADEIAEAYRMGRDYRLTRTISSTDLSNKSLIPFYVAADKPGTYLETTIGESAFANNISDSNTVGLWHLEEAAGSGAYIKDSSSYTNNGTPTGTTLLEGKIGKDRNFNGSSDYISVPDSANWDFGTGDFAVSLWMKTTSSATSRSVIGNRYNNNSDDHWNLEFYTTANRLEWHTSKTIMGTSVATVPVGQWTHIAITRTSGVDKFYINGVLTSSFTDANNYNNGQTLYIGKDGHATSGLGLFYGDLDEIRIEKISRSADDIRQAYEIGSRTHTVTIDFAANLDSGNLISDSSDTSFTIDATKKGLSQKGSNLFVGDKIIVRENYDGTEYIAQGTVDSVDITTGAVTVGSWDSGSTFPSSGYSINADVFKWQREYFDITSSMSSQRDAVTQITTRLTNGSEGHTVWLDDFESVSDYLTDSSGSTITSTPHQYFQYRLIPTTTNVQTTSSVSAVTLDYENSLMTIESGSTNQTSLNNNNKHNFNISVDGIICDEVDTTLTAQASWNQVDWYEVDQTITPVNNISLSSDLDVTGWNGYPTDGDIAIYVRAISTYNTSNVASFNIDKDTVNPIVTSVFNVAGDDTIPFNDATNDGQTDIIYSASDDAAFCRWSESDQSYAAMANTCGSTTACSFDLTGYGLKNIYMRCRDNAGNENNEALSPSPTMTYEIGGISINSASTDQSYINNLNKNSFHISAQNVIYEATSSNVTLQGSFNQSDWYDLTTAASPANDITITGSGDLTSWNSYPADGNVTIYVRARGGSDYYSNIKSFSVLKDTIEASVTGIVS